MDLREAILEEHSRKQVDKIIQWIDNEPEKVSLLTHIFMQDTYKVVQRAAWIISAVAEKHPGLIAPHIPALVSRLQDPDTHIAVKRNIYRIMQFVELPEAVHSDLMNSCFEAVTNPAEAAAVRAFGMSILARLSIFYPELKNELKLVIEDALRQETAPSFVSRAKKVLWQISTSSS